MIRMTSINTYIDFQIDSDLLDEFEENFDKSDGCWKWKYSTNKDGYASFSINGKVYLAHRISYLIYKGFFDEKLEIRHICNIPCCVNPNHLLFGTHQDNMNDMVKSKTRINKMCGSDNHKTLLDEEGVLEIRRLYSTTNITQKELADKFYTSVQSIDRIVNRRTWKHI